MNTRILLVDDEEANLATLEAILSPEGYELHTALNGPDACAAAARLNPDLVLLDVMMPGMDGFAVCRELRAALPPLRHVPILMLTALQDQTSRIEGIRAGADDFISKPCPFDELRARVRTITKLNRYRIIADQRARFQRLFDLAPSAIALVQPDGCVVTTNDHGAALLSTLSTAPLVGRLLTEGFDPADGKRLLDLIARTRAGDPRRAPVTLRISDATDGEHTFQASAALLDESPAPLVLLLLGDITAEVRAREDAEALNVRLEALVKARTRELEEANQLLMSYAVFVSHDLRSPLSVMKGYLSLLQEGDTPVSDAARALIDPAYTAAVTMDEMITDILKLASDEHHASRPDTPLDPRPIIQRLCWKLTSLHPKPKPLITLHPLHPVLATAPLVERIFFNLVSNAIKYSAGRPDPHIEIGSIDTPEGAALYVRDNGIGFDPHDTQNLFHQFSRLPNAGPGDGLGLGLSLVSRLVHAHHGQIWADGRPDEGATFYVRFPRANPDPSAAPPADPPPAIAARP